MAWDPERPGVDELVGQVLDIVKGRRSALASENDLACRRDEHLAVVKKFVEVINPGLFRFVRELHERLCENGFGNADLSFCDSQDDLVSHLPPGQDWLVKQFSLLRAKLTIKLTYHDDSEAGPVTDRIAADVYFYPNNGFIDWGNGTGDWFKSYRGNSYRREEFGENEFVEVAEAIRLQVRGPDFFHPNPKADEPEFIIARRIANFGLWPHASTY